MNQNMMIAAVAVLAAVALSAFFFVGPGTTTVSEKETASENPQKTDSASETVYEPAIQPEKFTSKVDNKYFPLVPGTKRVYEGQTESGLERLESTVTDEKKMVMGVETIVVWEREFLNGGLVEDTYDWFAQDDDGNVWYFGEDTKEFSDGKVTSTMGSWEAGVNGALPGIIMPGSPSVGQVYRQEYYKGEAEDMGEVVSTDATITSGGSRFTGCLKTKDWTPLEQGSEEHKYYCPGIGLVYEVNIEDNEPIEIVDGAGSGVEDESLDAAEEPKEAKVTKEQAVEIAKNAVNGTYVNVETEKKFGKLSYVVEMIVDKRETDVIVEIETGKVLGIEV